MSNTTPIAERLKDGPTPDWVSDCGTVVLFNGDCLDVLRSLPAGCADALVTDPPYSSGGFVRGDRMVDSRTKYTSTGAESKGHAFSGDNRDQRSFLAWSSLWLCASTHVAREGAIGCVFTDWRQLPTTSDAFQAGGWVWRGLSVWQKPTSRPMLGRFTNQAEYVVWGSNGPREIDGPTAPGWVIVPSPKGDEREHITQKPDEVMEWLLQPTLKHEVVLDPFSGSGTTGRAAVRLERQFIGVEIDADYFAIGVKRIKAELGRLQLFDPPKPQQQRSLIGEDGP